MKKYLKGKLAELLSFERSFFVKVIKVAFSGNRSFSRLRIRHPNSLLLLQRDAHHSRQHLWNARFTGWRKKQIK